MFEKLFRKEDFDKWIKIKKFDKHKFYVISVGDSRHEPTMEIISHVAENLQKTFPDLAFIVVPNYFRVVGFEPIESTNSEEEDV